MLHEHVQITMYVHYVWEELTRLLWLCIFLVQLRKDKGAKVNTDGSIFTAAKPLVKLTATDFRILTQVQQ